MTFKAVLFDLDGTLIDTAPDMVGSLNDVLKLHNYPQVSYQLAKQYVSHGGRALIELVTANNSNDQERADMLEKFLTIYASRVARESQPYEGILDTLNYCQTKAIPWGVVTNKPFALSRSLLTQLQLLDHCSVLLGGDSMEHKKPHPAPLLHCCMTLKLAASDCLYIGDHNRDIEAGLRAGMNTAVALWGYLQENDKPDTWRSDYLLSRPTSLLDLLQDRSVEQ